MEKDLDDKYKDKFNYKLESGANDSVELSILKRLLTYLSGTYLSAIIFIGLVAVLVIYYLILVIQEKFAFKDAYNNFVRGLNDQFNSLSYIFSDNPQVTVTSVIFGIAVFLFVISFFTYIGFYVALSNALKTILADSKIKEFYDKVKANKVAEIDKDNSKLFIEIIDLMKKTLDSSSTAISAFGVAGIALAFILIAGGVSNI